MVDVARDRLRFTPLALEDLPFLLAVRNECRDMLHDDREFSLQECESWFRETRPDFHVIWLGRERIGYFRLSNHDQDGASIYVGADLAESFRGRGLGRRAYEEFLPVLQEERGIVTARLEVLSHNEPALRLYQALGFAESNRTRDAMRRHGSLVDNITMAKRL